ncbi:MAG TPA: hypothetical protein VFA35_03370 [Burkholderiaceae bacterium]|nr:hypothetical protein [Burkholderiaceae bacterium]
MNTMTRSRTVLAAVAVAAAALAGCATTQVDAQWRSVELPPSYLRGASVLVSCETGEEVIKRICEDQLGADLRARGVRVLVAARGALPAVAPAGPTDAQYLPLARENGAKAVLSVSVGPSSQSVSPGISIGIGGFGFGRHSAGGIGVSAPIGGGQVSQGFAANGRVTDVASGRLMWTARASSPPSSDVNAQIAELSTSVLDAAATAGLF